jgi:O-antigen/teichoic acid export membrane protein
MPFNASSSSSAEECSGLPVISGTMSEFVETPLVAAGSDELPLETSAILRIFGRNTLWLWLDLGALRLGTMLAGLFLIRYFGPTNFGMYSTALATGWLANAVVDLGLTRYAARAVAATPEEAPSILMVSLLTTFVSVIAEILLLVFAAAYGHWDLACLAAGLVLCNFEGTASLCSSMLTAELRSSAILPGSIVGASGLICLTLLVIWFHLSVLVMLVGLCFKSLFVLGMRLWQLRSRWPARPRWRANEFLRVARQAWPFFSYNLTQVGYGRVAIICFGLVATQEKVGWFAAAFALSDIFPQWSYASSGALLPVWTRLYETKRIDELLVLRQRLLDIVLFLSVPLLVLMAVFAPQLCHFLGERFSASAPALRVVSSRSVLAVLDGFLGHGFLVAVNRVKERKNALARCVILLAVLSLGLGYLWGPVGVAVALLIADSTLILQYLRLTSKIGLKISWPAVLPSVIAGAAMAGAAIELPRTIGLALSIPAATAVYFLVLILLSRGRLVSAGRTLRECISAS